MNLKELIDVHRAGRSYEELSRDCGGAPTSKRLQQLARQPIKNFPDPETVVHLAQGLKVSQTAVILAAAESLGLDVGTPMPRLVELLPSDADQLSEEQAAAIAQLVRTIVGTPWVYGFRGSGKTHMAGQILGRGLQDRGDDDLEPTVVEVLAARREIADAIRANAELSGKAAPGGSWGKAVALEGGDLEDADIVDAIASRIRERHAGVSEE